MTDADLEIAKCHYNVLAGIVERARFDYFARPSPQNEPAIRTARDFFETYPRIPVTPPDRVTKQEAVGRCKSGLSRLRPGQIDYGVNKGFIRSYYYDTVKYINAVDMARYERDLRAKGKIK